MDGKMISTVDARAAMSNRQEGPGGSADKLNRLNLGCGVRYNSSWVNIDFVAASPDVIAHDLRRGIPSNDAAFDVVYHSHVLEHFSRQQGTAFLRECFRVLRPGGVIRVAVPDLEGTARSYLNALDAAMRGEERAEADHQWSVIELIDQMVRPGSGGEMAAYLRQPSIPNLDYVVRRIGMEGQRIVSAAKCARDKAMPSPMKSTPRRGTWRRAAYGLKNPSLLRKWLIRRLLGSEYATLQLGRFRQSGEVHQWMYDQYSLRKVLKQCGFVSVVRRGAAESHIDGWTTYNLDTEPDGTVYKPDSLYMEGVKP